MMDIIQLINQQGNQKKSKSKLLAKADLFDPYSQEFLQNPYPIYHRLRTEEPIHLSFIGVWVLSRYEDVVAVLQDDANFTAHRHNNFFPERRFLSSSQYQAFKDHIEPIKENLLLWIDPPKHTRVRSFISKVFQEFMTNFLREKVIEVVDRLIENLQHQTGIIDLMEELAKPLPIEIIASIMGIPTQELIQVSQWSQKTINFLEYNLSSTDDPLELIEEMKQYSQYMESLIQDRRNNPQEDLISQLILMNDQNKDPEKKLTDAEIKSICMLLFPAGEINTSNQIANCLLTLLRFPEQVTAINQESIPITKVVEELIRYDSGVQGILRITVNDVTIADQVIPKGKQVLLMIGAANRDPEYFDDPDELNFDRKSHHLGFITGIHNCLGQNLARMEIKIVLEKILPLLPQMKLTTEDIIWKKSSFFRGPESLPIIFDSSNR